MYFRIYVKPQTLIYGLVYLQVYRYTVILTCGLAGIRKYTHAIL
jgi:hypothetical protein